MEEPRKPSARILTASARRGESTTAICQASDEDPPVRGAGYEPPNLQESQEILPLLVKTYDL